MQTQKEGFLAGLERATKNHREKTAVVYLGTSFSFGQLDEMVSRFATGLCSLGIGDNDKVMLYMSNCPQWIIAYLAVVKIGALLFRHPLFTPFMRFRIKSTIPAPRLSFALIPILDMHFPHCKPAA